MPSIDLKKLCKPYYSAKQDRPELVDAPASKHRANVLSSYLRSPRDAGLVRDTKRGGWVDDEPAPAALGRLYAPMPRRRNDG